MANLSQYLQAIMEAVYGEEVRGSIYNAIAAMNTESSNAMQYASTAQDSAQASAQLADQKANAAATSEQNAATSKEYADLSAQNAFQSANAAAGYASDAVASKQNAVQAATAAALEAQDAHDSKAAAETAETNATTAKNAAESAASAAAGSAQNAEQSAVTAQRYSGNPPRPDSTTKTWWIWDAEDEEYVDSHIGSEIEGPQGVSVNDIVLVSGTHAPGSSDIYEVRLSDGSTKQISVWNGRNGEGSGDVLGTGFDIVLPASGWANGELTVSDQRFVALSTYKYIIGADDASRAEFLDCGVQPKDIRTNGAITFTCEYTPETNLTVGVVRLELAVNN